MQPRLEVVADVTTAASELIARCVMDAVRQRGRAVLCLSGGSTPVPVYQRLAQARELPWEQVFFAWGDERWVPHDDPESNFGSASRAMLDHLPVPEQQVLAWPYGPDPAAAASTYAATLTSRLGSPVAGRPLFDLNLLGLGGDGHTASLFPGSGDALRSEVAFATEVPGKGWRLTLGAPALSSSRTVLFLVAGEAKRQALATTWPALFTGNLPEHAAASVDDYPARAIAAQDDLVLITDVRPG